MKEVKKNQKYFENQTVLKITEEDFDRKCFECMLCSWRYSVVLIPETMKERFKNSKFEHDIKMNLDPNGVIAFY
jgi:hypothetical protein